MSAEGCCLALVIVATFAIVRRPFSQRLLQAGFSAWNLNFALSAFVTYPPTVISIKDARLVYDVRTSSPRSERWSISQQ